MAGRPEERMMFNSGLPQSLGHVILHLVLVHRSLLTRGLIHTHPHTRDAEVTMYRPGGGETI